MYKDITKSHCTNPDCNNTIEWYNKGTRCECPCGSRFILVNNKKESKTRHLNIPQSFRRHSEEIYGFESLKLLLKDGHFYLYGDIVEDEDVREDSVLIIRYSCKAHWIISLSVPMRKDTLDKFIELCQIYYDLGDNIIMLDEYGIMGE